MLQIFSLRLERRFKRMLRGSSDDVRVFQFLRLNEQKFTFVRSNNASSAVCSSRETIGRKSNGKGAFSFIRKQGWKPQGGRKAHRWEETPIFWNDITISKENTATASAHVCLSLVVAAPLREDNENPKCQLVFFCPFHLPQVAEASVHYFRNSRSLSHQLLSSYGVVYFICGTWLSLRTFGFLSEFLIVDLCCCYRYYFSSVDYFLTFLPPAIHCVSRYNDQLKTCGWELSPWKDAQLSFIRERQVRTTS